MMSQSWSFQEAVSLAKSGSFTESLKTFEQLIANNSNDYSSLVNAGTLLLQIGNISSAVKLFDSAIKLDPFCHIAYFNRSLCASVTLQKKESYLDLRRALSCLCLLYGKKSGNIKFFYKAISECEGNYRAYLERAKILQKKDNKAGAENQYLHAIECAPEMPDIYEQRALYFRETNQLKEFERDLMTYLRLSNKKRVDYELEFKEEENVTDEEMLEAIPRKIKEFRHLLEGPPEQLQAVKPMSLNLIPPVDVPALRIGEKTSTEPDEEMLLSDRKSKGSDRSDPSQDALQKLKDHLNKIAPPEPSKPLLDNPIEKEMMNQFNSKFEGIFQSDILRSGDLPVLQKSRQNSLRLEVPDRENFMTEQLTKTIQDISEQNESIGSRKVHSPRSSISSNIQTELSSRNFTFEDFSKYHSFTIQIVKIEFFDEKQRDRKVEVVINFRYAETTWSVKSSNGQQWPEKKSLPIAKQIDEIHVKVQSNNAGFIWNSVNEEGTGVISLLERKNTKCVFQRPDSKSKKQGLLYYKLKLE